MRRQVLATLIAGAIAATIAGCSSDATSPTSPIDHSPPAIPGNLHSTNDPATGREWLDWDPSATGDVSVYEIYISNSPTGPGSQSAVVDGSSSEYVLPPSVGSVTEYYRVRAIGSNDVPSEFTPSVSVTREGGYGTQPTTRPEKGTEDDN